MATAWGLAQFKPRPEKPQARYCAIDDYRDLITADGGTYAYREILGNYAVIVVKNVQASTLVTIANDPVIRPFPGVHLLNDSLSVLTDAQWANYRQFALDLGYPAAEWDAAFTGAGTQANFTLRDVIAFVCRRRITPRWDVAAQAIVLDGAVVSPAADPAVLDAGA